MKYLQSKLIVASVFLVNSLLLQTVAGFLMQPQAAANIKLTWETIFAEKIRQARNEMNEDRPYMVCITGIPGSGENFA
jgi:pantothenate kinase-related protein Tda10